MNQGRLFSNMKVYSLLKTIYYEKNNKSILDSDGY